MSSQSKTNLIHTSCNEPGSSKPNWHQVVWAYFLVLLHYTVGKRPKAVLSLTDGPLRKYNIGIVFDVVLARLGCAFGPNVSARPTFNASRSL